MQHSLPSPGRHAPNISPTIIPALTDTHHYLCSIKAKLEFNISPTASPITQLCVRLASWLELLENAADRCLEGGDVVEGERLQNLALAVGAPMEAPLPSPSSLQVGLQTDGRHRKTMFASSSADGASLGLDIDMLGIGSSLGYREQFGAHSMESESGWDRLERLQKLLSSCTEVVNTARTLAETAAAQHHFQVEDTLLASVAIIAPLYKKLTALMLTCHPLTKELALELSQPLHGGTAVLTSDLIFCIPCSEDGTCIGSLVVKVAYTPLLRMIYRYVFVSLYTLAILTLPALQHVAGSLIRSTADILRGGGSRCRNGRCSHIWCYTL